MPLTITLDTAKPIRVGKRLLSTGVIGFDNSYPTGGEGYTLAQFGMHQVLEELEFLGGAKGVPLEWDKANLRIKALAAAYSEHILNPEQAARDLAAAAADVSTWHVTKDTYVVGFLSVVTVALATETIAPVMSVEKRDADGTSNVVELATILYTDLDPVGTLDSYTTTGGAVGGGATTADALATPYKVPAGYTIVLKHKTQGTGAAAAGEAKLHIAVAELDPNLELANGYDLSGLSAVRFRALGY